MFLAWMICAALVVQARGLPPWELPSHPDSTVFFVRRGARLDHADWIGMVPLGYAANNDRPAMIEMLLKAGAKVDGPKGSTPPHQAAAGYGHVAIIRHLLRAGAQVDATDFREMVTMDGRPFLARVVVDERGVPPLVITVYRTTKLAQYREER